MSKKFFVYILECKDGSYYTGYTDDIGKRLKAHNSGKGAKYTRARRPCVLVYYEEFMDKSSAMKREYAVKQLSRKQKEVLICGK
jgi:putative endonuclease